MLSTRSPAGEYFGRVGGWGEAGGATGLKPQFPLLSGWAAGPNGPCICSQKLEGRCPARSATATAIPAWTWVGSSLGVRAPWPQPGPVACSEHCRALSHPLGSLRNPIAGGKTATRDRWLMVGVGGGDQRLARGVPPCAPLPSPGVAPSCPLPRGRSPALAGPRTAFSAPWPVEDIGPQVGTAGV